MWNFLLAIFAGSTVGSTRTARRWVRPVLALFFFGVLVAGVIYVGVIVQALSERSNTHHVSTRSSH